MVRKSVEKVVPRIAAWGCKAQIAALARTKSRNLTIRYAREDTGRSKRENLVAALAAAVEAGTNMISIADTTGVMVPRHNGLYSYVRKLRNEMNGCSSVHYALEQIGDQADVNDVLSRILEQATRAGRTSRRITVDGLGNIVQWCKL